MRRSRKNFRDVHFIGFRGDEYGRACLVFGVPDFVHKWHDRRVYGDVGSGDILIFANKEKEDYIREYADQDHERY